MINVMLPELVKAVLEILKQTIDCLASLYESDITHTPDENTTKQCIIEITEGYKNLVKSAAASNP